MADELNIPTHRWYQKRNHIALAKEDFSRQFIYDSGIQKIDAWINSQPWGGVYIVNRLSPPLVLDFIEDYYRTGGSASTFDDALNFSRASAATYTDADGVLQTAAAGVPRVGNHVYNGSEWVNKGLLLESEARTNLYDYSNDPLLVDGGGASNTTISANTEIDPAGGTEASLITATTAAGFLGPRYSLGSIGVVYTASFFLKNSGSSRSRIYVRNSSDGADVTINWSGATLTSTTDTLGTSAVEYLSGGYYRVSVTYTAVEATQRARIYPDILDGTNSIIAYGWQLEANASTPSSYIPTNGSTVTRAAETLDVAAADMPWSEPVVIGEELVTNGTFDTDTSGWSSGRVGLSTLSAPSGRLRMTSDNGTTDDAQFTLTGLTIGNVYRVTADVFIGTAPNVRLRVSGTTGLAGANAVDVLGFSDFSADEVFVANSTTMYAGILASFSSAGQFSELDNISVKEINPLAVSIQMDGVVTGENSTFADWTADASNGILVQSGTNDFTFTQEAAGVVDTVTGGSFTAGVNTPFNIASRHGSTFINGAVDGVALTENDTPTALPDLSATDFDIGPTFMGNIGKLRVWADDLGDDGIEEASAPTFTTEFAMTVTTTGADETFTIPCQDVGTFDAGIEWGDGSVSSISAYNDAGLTHTYATAGDHLIRIRGSFPNIYFNDGGDKLKVKSVENLGDVGWESLGRAFFGCSNMTSFTAGDADTSSVTNMSLMFQSCSSLTSLDVSGFDTSSVTSMGSMFFNCSSLASLDVSGFGTSSVTSMGSMFQSCSSLTSLDVSGFDTSSVTNMGSMFRDCTSLASLDVSGFDTSSVINMGDMFRDCTSLASLDVSGFDTSSVTSMFRMFYDCTSLTSLDVSGFDTSSVTTVSLMFYDCSSLTSLDVSGFDTSSVNNMSSMFVGCSSLTDVVGVEDFDIEGLNSTNDLNSFMLNVTLPTSRYDALLINWDAQDPFDGMSPDFGNSTYTAGSAAATARANLISNDGWTITDGGTA